MKQSASHVENEIKCPDKVRPEASALANSVDLLYRKSSRNANTKLLFSQFSSEHGDGIAPMSPIIMTSTATETLVTSSRVRLHITPFNADLYEKLTSATARAEATNVSFHTVETFPERGFGYLELSKMEAEKLKKKLNGTTLKGAKMRVEEARPQKKRKADETEEEREVRKKAKREKAEKEDGVLSGWEMEEGRHVKRGWTDENEAKTNTKAKKSKDGKAGGKKEGKGKKESRDGKKALFKTSVPPNAMPLVAVEKPGSKSKEKKAKKERPRKKETTLKEFSKSRKLVAESSEVAKARLGLTYEDGTGWLDNDGNVIEPEKLSEAKKRERDAVKKVAGSESEKLKSGKQDVAAHVAPAANSLPADSAESSEVESSEISSDNSDDPTSEGEDIDREMTDVPPAVSTDIELAKPPPTPVPREVHPLEALYKRPPTATSEGDKFRPTPIDTTFSFFAAEDVADAEDEPAVQSLLLPQTPHTKQDLEWRALRSAAPTPDTAAIGRKLSFPFAGRGSVDIEDDGDTMDAGADGGAEAGAETLEAADGEERKESEFRKWFYEHRGENNRAWRKKRREAKKLVRQRENRRVSRRVV